MDLEQLTEKVFHVAEIHIVTLGTSGCVGSFEDSSLVLVTLQKLLSVAAPLLLFIKNRNVNANTCHTVVHSSSSQPLQYISNNNPNNVTLINQDTGCLYHRYERMWAIISRSTVHPWGIRETVRFAVLTSYFQTQLKEIRQSLLLFKKVRSFIFINKYSKWKRN